MNMKIILAAFLCCFLAISVSAEPTEKVRDFIVMLEKESESGNPVAKYHLGKIYIDGLEGVAKDERRGFGFLLASAKAGYVQAQYNVAASYKLGQGIPQSEEQALYWYLQAATKGHAQSQLQAALMFHNKNEFTKSIELFNESAMKGIVESQFMLASVYHLGNGKPQNYRLAYIWYSIAAASGDADAVQMRDIVSEQLDAKTLSEAQKEAAEIFESIRGNE